MDIDKLLALILPGIQGSVSIALNDQQIGSLVQSYVRKKTSYINSLRAKNGYLELSLQLPLIGEKSINVEIHSINVRSNKLVMSLKLLNISGMLVKGVVALLGKSGIKSSMEGELLILDITDRWNHVVSKLPEEAKTKLNSIKIATAFTANKAEIHLIIPK